MSNLVCTTPIISSTLGTNFAAAATSMRNYYQFGPISDADIINAFNRSFGYDNSLVIFFQANVSSNDFNQSILNNFWNNNDPSTSSTPDAIDLITNFIINEGNRPVNLNQTSDPFQNFYTKFANPYANFIINYLFCNINPAINFNQGIVINNLYRLINGSATGDEGGTRGSGTKLICQYCSDFYTNSKITDPYNYISQHNFAQNFCGCCSELNEKQPSFYNATGTSIPLVCQPICHSNPVIKPYNGSGDLVNNGYSNNTNPSSAPDFTYLRRQCPGQTVCIIDNINISILGGSNEVVFNQICPGCNTSGGCICFIDFSDGGTIDTVTDGDSGLQNQVIFKQNCPVSLCSQKKSDSDGNLIETFVPCNPFNTSDTGKNPNTGYNGDGTLPPNSSNATKDNFIFGLSNWLVPVVFLTIAIVVVISILVVNLISIRREIYLTK